MTDAVTLKKKFKVASGKQRSVYLHPTDESKLIKVLRRNASTTGRSRFNLLTENWFPNLRLRNIRKEYLEYLRVMLSNQQPDFQPPISHMYGFVSTSKGLGCLTEKIVGEDGRLADTLRTLLTEDRFSNKHLELFNQTVERLYQLNIRASDLTPRNFVFGHRLQGGTLGPLECVVVDGFGDIYAIPIRSLSRWTNNIGLDDSFKRLARNRPIVWNRNTRQFSR